MRGERNDAIFFVLWSFGLLFSTAVSIGRKAGGKRNTTSASQQTVDKSDTAIRRTNVV
jgi:hypothetical protein